MSQNDIEQKGSSSQVNSEVFLKKLAESAPSNDENNLKISEILIQESLRDIENCKQRQWQIIIWSGSLHIALASAALLMDTQIIRGDHVFLKLIGMFFIILIALLIVRKFFLDIIDDTRKSFCKARVRLHRAYAAMGRHAIKIVAGEQDFFEIIASREAQNPSDEIINLSIERILFVVTFATSLIISASFL